MIKVDVRDVNRVIKDGKKLLKNARPFLDAIGRNEVEMSRTRIRSTKQDPDGRSWKGWAPSTREQRAKKGYYEGANLLYISGNLYRSMRHRATSRSLTITNTAPYAKYLQEGTRDMDARPFMGWSRESITDIRRIFRKHMRKWK